ncbi:D-lactate ferricytochrome c oxidoreductase [Lambiella insularis]|nr:D-lactate ferricytochrome c oxidoreductase [Lambiella insularis]
MELFSTATKIVQSGYPLAAIELLDDVTMRAVNEGGYTHKQWPEVTTLFLKFSGTSLQVKEQIREAEKFTRSCACTSFEFSKNEEEAQALWYARKPALWGLFALENDPQDKFMNVDAAVLISQLADIIDETKKKLVASGLVGSCLGHVGDGNFHAAVLYGAKDKHKAENIICEVQKMAVDMGGSVTGEHGVGLAWRDVLPYELGETTVDAMMQIKLALEPLCLLNPGKVMRLQHESESLDGVKHGTGAVGDSHHASDSP